MNDKNIIELIESSFDWEFGDIRQRDIENFIFNEILPKVLEDLAPWNWNKQMDEYDSNTIYEEIKKISKKQYNINL